MPGLQRFTHVQVRQRFFFAGAAPFLAAAAGAAGFGSTASGCPNAMICTRALTGDDGFLEICNCYSPRPSETKRLLRILKLEASTSRIESARRLLSVRLASHLPPDSV